MMKPVDLAIVEFANDAFYLAFNSQDLSAMDRLWATDADVCCVHPGWQPLLDRDEIIQSWESIFQHQGSEQKIICHQLRILTQGDIYSVICYEQLPGGVIIATNNFVMERGELKLVHHQGGQCMDPPDLETEVQTIQ